MHYGWSAPFIPVLQSDSSPVKVTNSDIEWLELLLMSGALLGLPFTLLTVDRIGRKNCLLMASATNLLAWILIALANRIEYLYVARFISGFASDVAFVASPMYIAEIADRKIRGFLSGLIYIMMLIGILTVYSIGPFVPIYVTCLVGIVILTIQLCTFPFMPDSPYYLMSKGRPEQAKMALTCLRGNKNVDREIEEISAAVKRQKSECGKPQDIVLVGSNRKALIIMSVLNGSQHLSGISVMLMNLHSILEAADSVYLDSNTCAILFALMLLVAASLANCLLDKCGRKMLLITSSFLTGVSLLTLAVYFHLKHLKYDLSVVSFVPICCVMFYAIVFKLGLGMVPIVMTAELFPTKVKALGMTLSDAQYILFSLVSIKLYQWLSTQYGIFVTFYVFAGTCLLTMMFSLFYIPETKGKSLEEIQFILKGVPHIKAIEANCTQNDGN